jgi:hypothetical protein
MAFQFSPKIVTDGLVLFLDAGNTKSYPGTGATWSDLSRSRVNGSLVASPTFNSSNGGSLVFNGSNQYVDCGDNDSLDGFGSFTLSTWFYINAFDTYTALFHKWTSSGGYSYFLGVWNSNRKINAGENYAITTGGETGNYGVVSNSTILETTWYQVTYTSTTTNISVYINGGLDNSINNNWRGGNIINSTTTLKLATHFDAPNYTNCRISNAMIYNRALSATEVLQNYNATKSRFGL